MSHSGKSFPSFESRWTIEGTITSLGPLHVGDGTVVSMQKRGCAAEQDVEVAAVCCDHRGRAYIPGSSIKGALRARVKSGAAQLAAPWTRLFGDEDAATEGAEGGVLEFEDAFVTSVDPEAVGRERPASGTRVLAAEELSDMAVKPPYWSESRATGVMPSVAIDRKLRTAREKLLYHIEFVPAGVTWRFVMHGDNLSEQEVADLLALLEWLREGDDDGAVRLGALTAKGWGQVRFSLGAVRRCSREALSDILVRSLHGSEQPTEVPFEGQLMADAEVRALRARAVSPKAGRRRLTIRLGVHFPGPLLVRDPRQLKQGKGQRRNNEARVAADALMVADERGLPVIPAKSLHGVLRSQAERIVRTLGWRGAIAPYEIKVTRPELLDPVSQLFGAPGWRAAIGVSALRWADAKCAPVYLHQEFIAIDRFTGGGQSGRKFDAKSVTNGRFTGTLTLDLERLAHCDAVSRSLGLLALVLRDLNEGDITIGSKASIGYGAAQLESLEVDGEATTLDCWPKAEAGVAALVKHVDRQQEAPIAGGNRGVDAEVSA